MFKTPDPRGLVILHGRQEGRRGKGLYTPFVPCPRKLTPMTFQTRTTFVSSRDPKPVSGVF